MMLRICFKSEAILVIVDCPLLMEGSLGRMPSNMKA